MKIVATNDAKTNLSRYLQEVSEGATIIIARGQRPVAKLVPIDPPTTPRPKVGQMIDAPLQIPDEVFAPLNDAELRSWGLR